MKIAYLLGSLNRGGTETLMLDVLRNADKAPFEMICIHRKSGSYQKDFYVAGPTIYHMAPKRLGLVRYLLLLRKLLQREGVTIVHGQQPLDTIYGRLATIGTGIKVVQTFHGFYPMKGKPGMQTRLSIRMSDELCFVSAYEQEWYQKHMKIANEKCYVVFNGIDFSKFDSEKSIVERKELRAKSGIRLCMVGNFMTGRDHLTLVHALELIESRVESQDRRVKFDFYFIGKKSESSPQIYDECIRICDEKEMNHVHFMGARSDVPALLKAMDGFVYSTDHDTFGIAVVEAIAAGLPVVVNDWPVMQEIGGDAVAYFRSKDVESCAEAIEQLLAELPRRKEAAKKNAAVFRKKYSIESYIETITKVYESNNNW